MVECLNGVQEVKGSNPFILTTDFNARKQQKCRLRVFICRKEPEGQGSLKERIPRAERPVNGFLNDRGIVKKEKRSITRMLFLVFRKKLLHSL